MTNHIHQVSDTAFMAAAYRAMETDRPDALFHDPLAARLAGERGKTIIANIPSSAIMGGWSVVIHTRVIDDLILRAVAEGIDTILNLGAGLDTRPYRMELPAALRWIEADYPHIIEQKEGQLAGETPRCQLERVGVDLADADARRALLDQVSTQSNAILVLTETVTPYLPEQAVAALGADLAAHEAVRYWLVDYFAPELYEYRRRTGMSKTMENAPFLFEPKDYFGFFAGIGWEPQATRYFAAEAEQLGRPAPFPPLVRFMMRILRLFASSKRRQEMDQYAGFVLFAPARAAGG